VFAISCEKTYLHLRNMLIKNNDLKIADFGISSFLTSTLTNCEAGTPAYQAPEIWNHKGSDFKSDVW
jgi:serine/threonine protein kinase